MSLPLSRRIAQAALLVAAGATPLVAAGVASASDLVPPHTDLAGGVNKLEGFTSGSTVEGTAHQLGHAVIATAQTSAKTMTPAAAATAGTALPEGAKLLNGLGHEDGRGTPGGPLAGTPLENGLPGASGAAGAVAPRAMPTTRVAALPSLPGVTGLDKVLGADALGNPTGALTGQAATRELATPLSHAPATDRALRDAGGLTGALPGAGGLTGALPGGGALAGTVPGAGGLGRSLPESGNLASALPGSDNLTATPVVHHLAETLHGTDHLAQSLPASHHLAGLHAAEDHLMHGLQGAADQAHPGHTLRLDRLSDRAAENATQRLGGVPDLGAVTGLLNGLHG
ncbi:hypothetical protein ACIGXM_07455 [Kitasatospora sp. NPDC052896]|uniref:hypothetical protein n=1 Tax=Kitasatospora sp. NPDC052896 TaxID=3364061 RepID=UPI0037C7FB8E